MVALRIELSATRLSAGFGRPALDYHQSRAPRSRTGTLLFPKQACSGTDRRLVDAPLPDNFSSVRTAGFEPAVSWPPTRRDNQASLRSDQVVASSPDQPLVGARNRTHLTALKERHPLPIDERAKLCAYSERSWPGGARILVHGSSNRRRPTQSSVPSSWLPAQVVSFWTRKNPMPFCDTGLWLIPGRIDQVSQAQGHGGQRIRRLMIGVRPYASGFTGDTWLQ